MESLLVLEADLERSSIIDDEAGAGGVDMEESRVVVVASSVRCNSG